MPDGSNTNIFANGTREGLARPSSGRARGCSSCAPVQTSPVSVQGQARIEATVGEWLTYTAGTRAVYDDGVRQRRSEGDVAFMDEAAPAAN